MNEKIKTSEEIKAELADKKVAKSYLTEFENGIKKELNGFLKEIKDFKPDFKVTHNVSLSDELKAQKIALNQVTDKLKSLSIPERIETIEKRENKIVFSNKTTQFLTWFCSICFVVAVIGAIYGFNTYQKIEILNKKFYEKGVLKGRKQLYDVSSPKNKKMIDEKFPNWSTQVIE